MSVLVQEKTKTLVSDIGKELRIFFPSVDFEITSGQEDGRTIINVGYTDGPARTRVRNITRQFSHSYYSERKEIKVEIDVERKMSRETENLLLTEMKSVWKIKGNLSMDDYCPAIKGKVSDYIDKIFRIRDFDSEGL